MILANVIGPSPWARIHDAVRPVGLALGFIGLGALGDGVMNGTAKLPWLHQQAAELRVAKTDTIPKLKAAAHCEDHRADRATSVAKQAIKGAVFEQERIPDARELPADNCPHPAGK